MLPTDEPETIPQSAEEMTATLAGPPEELPAMEFAISMKKFEIPVRSRNEPKITNKTMKVEQARIGVPITPSAV